MSLFPTSDENIDKVNWPFDIGAIMGSRKPGDLPKVVTKYIFGNIETPPMKVRKLNQEALKPEARVKSKYANDSFAITDRGNIGTGLSELQRVAAGGSILPNSTGSAAGFIYESLVPDDPHPNSSVRKVRLVIAGAQLVNM
jgi:hypothetical protein